MVSGYAKIPRVVAGDMICGYARAGTCRRLRGSINLEEEAEGQSFVFGRELKRKKPRALFSSSARSNNQRVESDAGYRAGKSL